MICQNCGARVDNDLIFCTNCGERLAVPTAQTVLMSEPGAARNAGIKSPKSSSSLKWLALIVALVAVPASIFGVYLLMSSPKNPPVAQNVNKPASPVPTPPRKAPANQNSNANAGSNSAQNNSANAVQNENAASPKTKTEVMNERIEIAPQTHYARPFKIEGDTATFLGKVELLQGETYKGFVYLQSQYDEHFPDELYKMFVFGEEKKSEVKSRLIPQDYVLIFVNETDESIVIQGNFWLE